MRFKFRTAIELLKTLEQDEENQTDLDWESRSTVYRTLKKRGWRYRKRDGSAYWEPQNIIL